MPDDFSWNRESLKMNSRCHGESLRNIRKARTASIAMVLAVVCAYCILFSPLLRAQINESIRHQIAATTSNPGLLGGIAADKDPGLAGMVRLPPGNPYHGYS